MPEVNYDRSKAHHVPANGMSRPVAESNIRPYEGSSSSSARPSYAEIVAAANITTPGQCFYKSNRSQPPPASPPCSTLPCYTGRQFAANPRYAPQRPFANSSIRLNRHQAPRERFQPRHLHSLKPRPAAPVHALRAPFPNSSTSPVLKNNPITQALTLEIDRPRPGRRHSSAQQVQNPRYSEISCADKQPKYRKRYYGNSQSWITSNIQNLEPNISSGECRNSTDAVNNVKSSEEIARQQSAQMKILKPETACVNATENKSPSPKKQLSVETITTQIANASCHTSSSNDKKICDEKSAYGRDHNEARVLNRQEHRQKSGCRMRPPALPKSRPSEVDQKVTTSNSDSKIESLIFKEKSILNPDAAEYIYKGVVQPIVETSPTGQVIHYYGLPYWSTMAKQSIHPSKRQQIFVKSTARNIRNMPPEIFIKNALELTPKQYISDEYIKRYGHLLPSDPFLQLVKESEAIAEEVKTPDDSNKACDDSVHP